jgi:FkbM family methyltransferase
MKLVADGTIAVLSPEQDGALSRRITRDGDLTSYDPRIRELLCPMIPVGGVVIDGGAFIGDHTVAFSDAVGPTGHVWAFEPETYAFDCLLFNTAARPNVTPIPAALSATRSFVKLIHVDRNGSATYVHPADKGIDAVPLDLFQFDRLDFMKLDLEGFELHALKGAEGHILRHHPILVIESGIQLQRYGDTHEDLVDWLNARGYDVAPLPLLYDHRDVFDILAQPRAA